jgi:LysR family transcriptional regulator, transcriptional activator of the cysJI operon
VSLDDLKVFCDVVETGSFSRAAALNSVTQTAVSRKIQTIESQLDCRLIERSKGRRGTTPTPAGTIFYEGCREILARYRDLVDRVGESRGEVSGTVRVETVPSVGLHELTRPVKAFLRRHPRATIHLEYNRSNRIYDDCLTERVDLGIVAYPVEQQRIGVIHLKPDRLVMICAPEHRLARRRKISIRDLEHTPFVAFEKDIPTRQAIDRHTLEAGVTLDICMEVDNIETIKRSVEVGLGISVVPAGTVLQETRVGSLKAVPIEPPCERPIGVIYKRSRPFTLTMRRFIDVLLESDGS